MSRKFSIGKVASRSCWAARGASTAPAEAPRLVDQIRLRVGQPERVGGEDRRVGIACRMVGACIAQVYYMGQEIKLRSRSARCAGCRAQRSRAPIEPEVQHGRVERPRRFQVRHVADAGQADVARAGDLRRHPLHHGSGCVAVVLAGKTKHRHADARQVCPFVESHEAAHGRPVGALRSQPPWWPRTAPGRLRRRPVPSLGRRSRARAPPWSCRRRAGRAGRRRTCVWNSPSGLPKAGLVHDSTAAR